MSKKYMETKSLEPVGFLDHEVNKSGDKVVENQVPEIEA